MFKYLKKPKEKDTINEEKKFIPVENEYTRKDRLLCQVSEIGKIVVNNCLDRDIKIDVAKLEKLLVIIQGISLAVYKKPFFTQDIVIGANNGPIIMEIDRDFIRYVLGFKRKLTSYYCTLEYQEGIIDFVLTHYGLLNCFEINQLEEFQKLAFWYENKGDIVDNEILRQIFVETQGIVNKFDFYSKLNNSRKLIR